MKFGSRRLDGEQHLNGGDHIANSTYALEVFRPYALACHLLQLDSEVDGVDAVEVKFLEEVSLGCYPCRINLECLGEYRAQFLQNLFVVHSVPFLLSFARSSVGLNDLGAGLHQLRQIAYRAEMLTVTFVVGFELQVVFLA